MAAFLKRLLAAALALLCLAPAGLAQDGLAMTDRYFAGGETLSGYVEVPGWGTRRYYAQNDGLWGSLVYEGSASDKRRPMRDGACGPTAAAMAIRALLTPEELFSLSGAAQTPFSLCVCSINRHGCNANHPRYLLTSVSDYDRFLPLVIADIASGNNLFRVHGRTEARGTNMYFLSATLDVIGIGLRNTQDRQEAFDAMKNGAAVFCSAGAGGVFTNVGHYVFLAGYDEERVYFLDPLCRDVYKTNHASSLTNHGGGLVSVPYQYYGHTSIYSYYVLTRRTEGETE